MINPISVIKFFKLLKESMTRLREGDFTQEIRVAGRDDVAKLASDFNEMVRKMRELSLLRDELIREKISRKEIESRLTALVNNLNVGVYRNTIGPHGVFLEVNSAMIELFEAASKDELMRHTVSDLYVDPSRRAIFSEKLARQGFVKDEEIELITLKGRKFWASVIAVSHRDEKGGVFFDGVIEDVSVRKQSREKLKHSYDIQSSLASIMSISLEKVSMQELLEHILNEIISTSWLSVESSSGIFLIEDDTRVLTLKSEKNISTSVQEMCRFVPIGHCLCGRAAQTGEIVFADRIDERHENIATNMAAHGHYCVPLKLTGGKVLGVLVLYLKSGYVRDTKKEAFLMTLGNVVAAIIERKSMEIRLLQKIGEIDKLNYFMVGREKRIVELKKEVDEALKACGKPPRYNIL